VKLTDGRVFESEAVVLATGLQARIEPQWLATDHRIMDAWDECALATLPRDGRVLILGAGLTALDVLCVLQGRGFRGSVTVLSRRGLLPRPHLEPFTPAKALSAAEIDTAPRELRHLLRWVRKLVERTVQGGQPWQHAIDSLRPHISLLWKEMPHKDRARFVRSVRPYWDVLRHRAPADALAVADAWRDAGRFELVAASVKRCVPSPEGLNVDIAFRGGRRKTERYDAIVRCIGPALEHSDREAPLVSDLLRAGLAQPDPAGLGIVTDDMGRVIDKRNHPSARLFAIGALRRASNWETTAVPDISVQASNLAKTLLG
jgi:uncharacterized NAD(P)/FAD-binding protein YdhS